MTDDGDGNCVICQCPLINKGRQKLSCGHVLHEVCVTQYRRHRSGDLAASCPICRRHCPDLTPVQRMLDIANEHYASKSYVRCIGLLREILDLDPETPSAHGMLGYMYLEGLGVQKDYKQAYEFYQQAHAAGDISATCQLGYMYLEGLGVQKDYKQAHEFYQQAHAVGYIRATCQLGYMYLEGLGVQKDDKQARKFYQQAHVAGDTDATYNLGYIYLHRLGVQKDYKQAHEFYQQAHAVGYTKATCQLGYMYLEGLGVQKDYKQALEYFQQAHAAGQTNATYQLGHMYLEGLGVQKDDSQARKFYQQAHAVGYTKATCQLGYMYLEGLGVQKDYKQAHEFYQQAHAVGHTNATCQLGYMYLEGLGVQKDYKQAHEFYQQAHAVGYTHATYHLGYMYLEGLGVQKDYKQAHELYQRAHAVGHTNATWLLGYMYLEGLGVQKDYKQALEYFQQAHAAGNTDAMSQFGDMYLHELGMQKDYKPAHEFDQQAHTAGDAGARASTESCISSVPPHDHVNAAAMRLTANTIVTVIGLTSEVGQLLNGQTGRVISFDDKIARYSVKLDVDGSCKKLKASNVSVAGTVVEVFGLVSIDGLKINGQTGRIMAFDSKAGRYQVKLDMDGSCKKVKGFNLKALRQMNLPSAVSAQQVSKTDDSIANALQTEIELHLQGNPLATDDLSVALEASLAVADARTANINAQLGEAILGSRELPGVHLLEYSRVPDSFERELATCEELIACCAELQACNFPVRHKSGVKFFVEPELYEPAISALEPYSEQLRSRHIVASDSYVGIVRSVLSKIPKKLNVKEKRATLLACETVADDAQETEMSEALNEHEIPPVLLKNTFLHVVVSSSILTSDPSVKARSSHI